MLQDGVALWQAHTSSEEFLSALEAVVTPDHRSTQLIHQALEGFLIAEAVKCGAAKHYTGKPPRNPTKLVARYMPWFDEVCAAARTHWHQARFTHGSFSF